MKKRLRTLKQIFNRVCENASNFNDGDDIDCYLCRRRSDRFISIPHMNERDEGYRICKCCLFKNNEEKMKKLSNETKVKKK